LPVALRAKPSLRYGCNGFKVSAGNCLEAFEKAEKKNEQRDAGKYRRIFLMPDGVSKTVIKLSHGLEVHRSVSSTIHANEPHISEMALNVKKKQKERRPMSRQRSPPTHNISP
jgi:hypothetical protein